MTATQLATTVANVPVDRLAFHPRNVRRQLGDLRELAASIAEVGVLQPLLVERRPGAEVLRVLAGHRRLQASRMAGLKKVPCVLVEPHTDAGAIALMLTENLQRVGLTAAERRDAVGELMRAGGYTVAQVAQLLGRHPTTVYGWLSIGASDEEPQPEPGAVDGLPVRTAGGYAVPASPPARARTPMPRWRVRPSALVELVERWRSAGHGGQVDELLDELEELVDGWRPR